MIKLGLQLKPQAFRWQNS